ncbi:MAG: putative amino acid transporter substrate binding protein [Gemmatimonadetes bacterium]|nr:putative amino acid transporter substrate binding protein [Gemmatimonadota bacterium]
MRWFGLAGQRRPMGLALVVGTCALVWACNRGEPYLIGVVLDADGQRGATLAAQEVNERGGIDGHPIQLVRATGASSSYAREALAAAESLTSNHKLLAVVGHTNSGASLAASQIYNAQHVVQIAPTSTTPLYSRAGPYSFRMVASDVHQGAFLAEQVLAYGGAPRVGVLFVNDDYGRGLHDVLVNTLRSAGVQPVYDAPFATGDHKSEFDGIVASLARARPRVLVWVGRSYQFRSVSVALRRALPSIVVLASDGFGGPDLSLDSLHVFDGVRYVRLFDFSRRNVELERLRRRYVSPGFPELTDQAVLSYDAVTLLAEAVRHAGPRREAIRDWLARVGNESPPFVGLSGPVAFPSGGDRAPAYFMEVVDDPLASRGRSTDSAPLHRPGAQ